MEFIYTATDTLFGKYVSSPRGLVDYEGIYKDELLDILVDTITHFDMSRVKTREDSLAIWINAYNIIVIAQLRNFNMAPDYENFLMFRTRFTITGEELTLDQLEKATPDHIKNFNDPRTHFALVCGAWSCPPLLDAAFRGEILYEQLDQRSVVFLNNTELNRIDADDGPYISSLFTWYKEDFAGFVRDTNTTNLISANPDGTEIDYYVSYLMDQRLISILQSGTIKYEYSWKVNKQPE